MIFDYESTATPSEWVLEVIIVALLGLMTAIMTFLIIEAVCETRSSRARIECEVNHMGSRRVTLSTEVICVSREVQP